VQYRFPEALARFPSSEFYEGRLRSFITSEKADEVLAPLERLAFPWPRAADGRIVPAVFVHCSTEEDYGGVSKQNVGQAALVRHIVRLLTTSRDVEGGGEIDNEEDAEGLSIAVLTPYTKQRDLVRHTLSGRATASTVDAFQGREADIVLLCTVRANMARDIGFVADMRRLNVAWTRARRALIVVGDRVTLAEGSELWARGIGACALLEIDVPGEGS
jgi:superfamily I DNA and/or RNA helicase